MALNGSQQPRIRQGDTMTPAQVLKQAQRQAASQKLEKAFELQLLANRIPHKREVVFSPKGKWRLDFVIEAHGHRLGIEVQGAIWTKGAHSSGTGITRDCKKTAAALIAGISVMPITGGQIDSGEAIQWVQEWINSKETTDE